MSDSISFCLYGIELNENEFYQKIKDLQMIKEIADWIGTTDNISSLVDEIVGELDPYDILQSWKKTKNIKDKTDIYYDRNEMIFWIGVNLKHMRTKETKEQFYERVQKIISRLMGYHIQCKIIDGVMPLI